MKLICMAFDGDFKIERPVFEDEEKAWEYSNTLGSKWYFYPFHFVTTDSVKTIVGTGPRLEFLVGWRVGTVEKLFNRVSLLDEAAGIGIDAFVNLIQENDTTWTTIHNQS